MSRNLPVPPAGLTVRLQQDTAASTYQRGQAYAERGAVGELETFEGGVRAAVRGEQVYSTWLAQDGDFLDYSCSCPVGSGPNPCKHVVALGLCWQQQRGTAPATTSAPHTMPESTETSLETLVRNAPAEVLARWLLQACQAQPELAERIELSLQHPPDVRVRHIVCDVRLLLQHLQAGSELLDSSDLARALDRARTQVQDLAQESVPAALRCLELLLHELAALHPSFHEKWWQHLPSGCESLYRQHRRLWQAHPADVRALARFLLDIGLAGQPQLADVLPSYQTLLGAEGCWHFDELLRSHWGQLPALTPHDAISSVRNDEPSREFLQSQMERLTQSAPWFERVRVLAKDLRSGARYARVLECILQDPSEAAASASVGWAHQALTHFAREEIVQAAAIRSFLRAARDDEALGTAWRLFEGQLSAQSYQTVLRLLQGHPALAAEFRRQALSKLQERAESRLHEFERVARGKGARAAKLLRSAAMAYEYGTRDPVDELAQVYLVEEAAELLWTLHDRRPLRTVQWPALARLRARDNLEDALALWRELLPSAIESGDTGYTQAVKLLQDMKAACVSNGASDVFDAECSRLREAYKRRRNLVAQLDVLATRLAA